MATPVVLAAILIVIMMTTTITQLTRSSYGSQSVWDRRVSTSWLLQAGLNRSAEALITPGDPLRERLFKNQTSPWEFEGQKIELRLESESEKIDVNAADLRSVMDRIGQGLAGALPSMFEDIETALTRARDQHVEFASPEAVLPLTSRFGPMRELIRRNATVLTGQSVPSRPSRPSGTDIDGLAGVESPTFGRAAQIDAAPLSRPIYRITATLVQPEPNPSAPVPSASVTVMLSANDQSQFRVVEGHL